jgi:cation diffusion facilitator CzcD-associated flavoprotein CzcO
MAEHLDVIIIGAGLSGICAGAHLRQSRPNDSFAMIEARAEIGGTWDLFRYPGIRSDSDMFTFGYRFRPWTEGKDIASASSIMRYLNETIDEYRLRDQIRFGQRITAVNWSSAHSRWEVDIRHSDGSESRMTCGYLIACSGYYNYDNGYRPDFPGVGNYKGQIVHPQHWPEGLDYAGKRVLVIGSGATAVTLVPALAETAAHVTMLQRSPTYVFNRPSEDAIAIWARRILPDSWAHKIARVKNILLGIYVYSLSQRRPEKVKAHLMKLVRAGVGPDVDVEKHFNPTYGPWDQRLCLIPDGDLFEALKGGKASIVTDQIETFTEAGVRTHDGTEIEADIIVTATGLEVQFLGGAIPTLDGEAVSLGDLTVYRGMMLSNVPNFSVVFGYTNASWTLKADLTCAYIGRLLSHMEAGGYQVVRPVPRGEMERKPLVSLESGYLLRANDRLPKQGAVAPWKNHENYIGDMLSIRYGRFDDGVLTFS